MGRRHLKAARELGLDVVGLCDPSEAARATAAQEAGLPADRLYADLPALLAARRPACVIVASTGPYHAPAVRAAVAAGARYILCEKPMATSGAEAREMADLCAQAGCRLAVNLSRRYAPRYIELRALLASGALGAIRHVQVAGGAGGLGCIGTHYFDLVGWLLQARPQWASGRLDPVVTPNVRGAEYVDPGGRGLVGYDQGATAYFELSGDVQSMAIFTIVGTIGYVEADEWSGPRGGRLDIFTRPPAQRDLPPTRFVVPERRSLELADDLDPVAMARACLRDLLTDHREQTVTGGIDAVETVMAFHLSDQRDGARVALPLQGADRDFRVPIT